MGRSTLRLVAGSELQQLQRWNARRAAAQDRSDLHAPQGGVPGIENVEEVRYCVASRRTRRRVRIEVCSDGIERQRGRPLECHGGGGRAAYRMR